MNNHSPRKISVNTSIFLPDGNYKLEKWEDKNAEKTPQQLTHGVTSLTKGDNLIIKTGKSGGYVGILTPIDE